MALQLIYTFTGGSLNDKEVHVYWNTDTLVVEATYNGSFSGSDPDVVSPYGAGTKLDYDFCQNTTLIYFLAATNHPYATKEEDPTAAECAVRVCNLAVSGVATTEATGSDGTATVSYSGTVSNTGANVRYSIDNATWQTSNAFAGLSAGNYTAYIRDEDPLYTSATWCKAQTNFIVEQAEAYGPRWALQFDEPRSGKVYDLKIFKLNYTGPVAAVIGGADPITINYSESDKDKYEALKGTQADIGLISEVNMQFLDFFSSDEREHRVDLMEDNALYWRGYILPDVYGEAFISAPYQVSVTASDGLNSIKNYPYLDHAGNRITGERSLLDVIFDCLDNLDLDLPLRSIVDVYEEGMTESSDTADTNPVISDPLFQAMVDTSNFIDSKGAPIDCEKVLRYCLEFLGARIYQSKGKWIIECIDAKRAAYWAVDYSADRAFVSYSVVDPIIDVSIPTEGGLIWIDGSQALEIISANRKTVASSELQVITNIVPGGDLINNEWEFDGNNLVALKHWTVTRDFTRYVESLKNNKNAVEFYANAPVDFTEAGSMTSQPIPIVSDGAWLLIQIEYSIQDFVNGGGGAGPELYFQLESVAHSYSNEGWVPFGANTRYREVVSGGKGSFELITVPVPATGDYVFRVYEIARGNAGATMLSSRIHRASIQILPGAALPLEYSESEITNPGRYTFTPDAKEVYFTDTQPSGNFKKVHRNYIAVNGLQSSSWHIKGSAENNGILNLLAANMGYNYSRPSHVLRGKLQGAMTYENTIREQYDQGRVFMANGLSINPKLGTYDGTFYELITELVLNPGDVTTGILTEAGDFLLLETGEYLLTE